jgi:NAD(P)-dependent dehydrogenase (short-subunit alcohol dehydrogenase family)
MSKGQAVSGARLLEGRTAIVSGIGPGLGRDSALALARSGARVALLARSEARLAEVGEEVEALGVESMTIQTDVTRRSDCERAAEAVAARFGSIDVLVNNAFTLGGTKSFLESDLEADWHSAFDVNLFGTLQMTRPVAERMRETGGGSIVMINTVSVKKAEIVKEFAAYASSKAALRTAARYLAEELGPFGIRVNSVTPGRIMGDSLLSHLDRVAAEVGRTGAELRTEIESKLPLRHIVGSDEIADAVVFFASDLSRAVTGVELDVNGGEFIPA